jgi:hypothetical protein
VAVRLEGFGREAVQRQKLGQKVGRIDARIITKYGWIYEKRIIIILAYCHYIITYCHK